MTSFCTKGIKKFSERMTNLKIKTYSRETKLTYLQKNKHIKSNCKVKEILQELQVFRNQFLSSVRLKIENIFLRALCYNKTNLL